MELRVKQSRDLSPDRAKPMWVEPKSKLPRKVQVVYYLSRNGQLEHPHFMEVTLSSNEGLYLRDIMHRLNTLRGKGMPYLFSWSSKRSYKSGYVWHDLSEDDIIYPAQGNEYVLKGSELFEGSSDRYQQGSNGKLLNPKHPLEGTHSGRYQDTVSSTNRSLVVHKQRINNGEESTIQRTNSLCNGQGPQIPFQGTQNIGLNIRQNTEEHRNPLRAGAGAAASVYDRRQGSIHKSYGGEASWSPLELGEYKVYKTESIASTVDHGADAATQTEDKRIRCTKGVSTEEEEEGEEECNSTLTESKENRHEEQKPTELSGGEVSPPPSSSGSPGSPNSKIKPNSKPNSFRCHSIEEENFIITTKPRASNVLLQLISCGSIAVKDHNFVGIPYSKYQGSCDESRSSSSRMKLVSSTSSVAKRVTAEDEFERMPENPRLVHLHLEDKEYFSGSIVETKTEKEAEGEEPTLKRSASYNADRSSKSNILVERPNDQETGGIRAKCIPRKIKTFKKQQSRNEIQKTPSKELKETSKLRRLSTGTSAMTQITDNIISSSKTSNLAADGGSQRSESFRNSFREEQKIIKRDHHQRQSSVSNLTAESQATSNQDAEGTLPTIELRQHLQECRISEMTAKIDQRPNSSGGSQNCKHQNTS